jgi:hypothetical protein
MMDVSAPHLLIIRYGKGTEVVPHTDMSGKLEPILDIPFPCPDGKETLKL